MIGFYAASAPLVPAMLPGDGRSNGPPRRAAPIPRQPDGAR